MATEVRASRLSALQVNPTLQWERCWSTHSGALIHESAGRPHPPAIITRPVIALVLSRAGGHTRHSKGARPGQQRALLLADELVAREALHAFTFCQPSPGTTRAGPTAQAHSGTGQRRSKVAHAAVRWALVRARRLPGAHPLCFIRAPHRNGCACTHNFMETDASKAAAMGLSSPVSVVGFACASAELPSPRSSGGSSSRVRSSVSLLSLLLTSQTSPSAGHRGAAAEDCYDEDASEEDELEEEDGGSIAPKRRVGAPSEQHAHDAAASPQHQPLRRAATAPMDVPTAM